MVTDNGEVNLSRLLPASSTGYLFALLAASLWASTPVVMKMLLGGLGNLEVLLCSSLVATVTLFLLCWATGKLAILRNYKARDIAILAVLGLLGVFAYRFFLQAAL